MATTEAAANISDHVTAAMITVEPELARVTAPLPDPPEQTPIADAAHATLEQTGADPPPGA